MLQYLGQHAYIVMLFFCVLRTFFIFSAEEEQKSKGIDNSIECPPDVDRET